MASNPVSSSCSGHAHGYSKAQLCFFKILHVISSVPPSQQQPSLTPRHDPSNPSPSTRTIDVDFNLESRWPSDNAEFECSASDSSAVEETDSGHKSLEVSGTKETRFEEHMGEDREGKEKEEGSKTVQFGGDPTASCDNCLDLLIEAAKLVFEEPSEEKGPGSGLRQRRRNEGERSEQRWVTVDLCDKVNDTSPVVRSKRGRTQALPFRFRDSVVEPLKRSAGTARAPRKRFLGS